jgi:hypothetical protein
MALANCTIDSKTITISAGTTNIATQVLTITPDNNFTVSAVDFTNNTASNPAIQSITLTNSSTPHAAGNTVLVTVDLVNSYAMPNTSTTITIDIDGKALYYGERPITLAGTWDASVGSNISPSSSNGNVYSATGSLGTTHTLFSVTFTCASGFFFDNANPFSAYLTTGDYANYSFSQTNTMTGINGVTYHTAVRFDVDGIIPNADVSGDNIDFTFANAVAIPSIGNEITSYSMDVSTIPQTGVTRTVRVYGTVGATFTITATNEDTHYYNFTSDTFNPSPPVNSGTITIGSEGYAEETIIFPSVTDDDLYTIAINKVGATQDNITQTEPFQITQLTDKSITFSTNSASGRSYTSNPSQAYTNPIGDIETSNQHKLFNLVLTDNENMVLRRAPLTTDFVKTNIVSPGGGNNSYVLLKSITSNPPYSNNMTPVQSITLTCDNYLYSQGALNATAILALDNFINIPPVASNVGTVSVLHNTVKTIPLAATDANGDSLTYSVVSNSLKGSVSISSNVATFTPNNGASGMTTFTYKANDSFQDSNTATVTLSIAGSGQVISLNDTWWWNDSTQNNTYTGIASATNQGSLSTSGFTVGATSFTASVSNWNLSNSLAGLPSYIDHSGDFTVNFIFKNANGTTLDSDTISIDQFNGTFNSSGSTLHIPSFTITPGESLTAQAYQLQIRVRYANVLQ